MRHSTRQLAFLAILLGAVVAPSRTLADIRTVALSGQPAPGTEEGVEFFNFWPGAVINNSGQTAFRGLVAGVGTGIWSEGSGSLELVALKGNQAPGAPDGFVFNHFLNGRTVNNDAGQTVFGAGVISEGDEPLSSSGVWSHDSAGTRLVVLHGAQVPGYPADVVCDINSPAVLNGNGHVALAMDLKIKDTTTVVAGGIWTENAGSLSLLVDFAVPPLGEAEGVMFVGSESLTVNDVGDVAFWGWLGGEGVSSRVEAESVWATDSGQLRLVAHGGHVAPGTEPGVTFSAPDPRYTQSEMYRPSFNDAGQTAFFGFLAGPGIDDANDTGVWSEGDEGLQLVARDGEDAPGTDAGIVFSLHRSQGSPYVVRPPLINADGKTAFDGALSGIDVDDSNNQGVWSDAFGELELVARGGDPAPGTEDSVMFDDMYLVGLNALGQALVVGTVVGDGVTVDINHQGIWAQDINGVLELIARTGDQLEVASGDFRTLKAFRQLGYSGNEDGRTSSFNDRGQVVFTAAFTDGSSGVFVSDRVAIPEPGTAVLAVLEFVFLAPRRAHRS